MPANARDTGSIPDLERSHMPHSNRARVPQLLRRVGSRAHVPQQEKPPHREAPAARQLEKSPRSNQDPARPNNK